MRPESRSTRLKVKKKLPFLVALAILGASSAWAVSAQYLAGGKLIAAVTGGFVVGAIGLPILLWLLYQAVRLIMQGRGLDDCECIVCAAFNFYLFHFSLWSGWRAATGGIVGQAFDTRVSALNVPLLPPCRIEKEKRVRLALTAKLRTLFICCFGK